MYINHKFLQYDISKYKLHEDELVNNIYRQCLYSAKLEDWLEHFPTIHEGINNLGIFADLSSRLIFNEFEWAITKAISTLFNYYLYTHALSYYKQEEIVAFHELYEFKLIFGEDSGIENKIRMNCGEWTIFSFVEHNFKGIFKFVHPIQITIDEWFDEQALKIKLTNIFSEFDNRVKLLFII